MLCLYIFGRFSSSLVFQEFVTYLIAPQQSRAVATLKVTNKYF